MARSVHPAARVARPSFLPTASVVEEDSEEDEWDGNALVEDEEPDEGDEPDEGADDAPAPARRGQVRTATWRRGRVPQLLQDVIEARVVVTRAERDLAKKVTSARSHGATWEEIGLALGMTRQGAAKRFG
jgi:hypothetical protein